LATARNGATRAPSREARRAARRADKEGNAMSATQTAMLALGAAPWVAMAFMLGAF
jgi:hypothetical protein